MASAILSSLLSLILNLEEKLSKSSCNSIAQDLDMIKVVAQNLNAVADDAEEREMGRGEESEPVKRWLRTLKDAAHDAEDVLEDLDSLLRAANEEVATQLSSIASRIEDIRESLVGISDHQRRSFHFVEREGLARGTRASSSVDDEYVVFGREDDKKKVIDSLLSGRRSRLSVLPVVGAAGVGKTTLARLVYNDPMVSEKFDVKFWVSGSHDATLVRLLTAIVASLDDDDETSPIYSELGCLRGTLGWKLGGKRFLFVLDGARNEDRSLWRSLWVDSLADVGLEGSAVLLTTDNESVARAATQTSSVPFFYGLGRLSDHNCWQLFRHCANGDRSANANLTATGKRIAERCRGSPMAAKMLGILLSSETEEARWRDVAQSDLWGSAGGDAELSAAISLCYIRLPANLRRCFAYCALFPKDHLYKRDTLVRLWMAQGFIQSAESKQLEDVGTEYFDELLGRAFFQRSPIDDRAFVQNDCVHDLAQSVSEYEICRTEDDGRNVHRSFCESPRHASVVPQDFQTSLQVPMSSLKRTRPTRTFLVINSLLATYSDPYLLSRAYFRLEISAQSFTNTLEYIRTLDLSGCVIQALPDSIDALKHLRYLGLANTMIIVGGLPESLCNLCRLQTLDLTGCERLYSLPRGIEKLKNLRHLLLPQNRSTVLHIPPGIGFLTNLQTLNTCHVWREGTSSMMREFKGLVNLTGELEISGLENVPDAADVRGVLKDKGRITKLTLRSNVRRDFRDCGLSDADVEGVAALFGEEREQSLCSQEIVSNRASDEDVIEALQPHTNLEELAIQSYFGERFPSWVGDSSFASLVSVTLDGCFRCRALPALGQLPSLRHLVVRALIELRCVGRELYTTDPVVSCKGSFLSLETLHFGRMDEWEEWLGVANGEFPRLRELELDCCPKLRRMPPIFPSLSKLVMRSCKELTVLDVVGNLCSLERLTISDCRAMTSSGPLWGLLFRDAVALKILRISHCPEAVFSPWQRLPSALEVLEISCCPLLTEWCHGHGSSELLHVPRVILDQKDFHPTEGSRLPEN